MYKRHRRFQITINNYDEQDIKAVKDLVCRYKCYCLEAAPTTGTPHIHLFVCFKNPKSFNTIKKIFKKAHIEATKGSLKENIAYIKKHGDFKEEGEMPEQGKRSDLEEIATKILDEKAELSVIAHEHPGSFIRYSKGIKTLKMMTFGPRKKQPKIYWLYGDTGTGKTRTAVEHSKSFYIKDLTKWWDGYQQQEVLIIDDFDGEWPFRNFLRLLDRYPYQGQFKGGYVHINSPIIYITSEFGPDFFYTDTKLAQIKRRIKESGGEIRRMIKLKMPPKKKLPKWTKLDDDLLMSDQVDIDLSKVMLKKNESVINYKTK